MRMHNKRRSNMIVPEKLRNSIESIVNYLWEHELKDYLKMLDSEEIILGEGDHIFEDLYATGEHLWDDPNNITLEEFIREEQSNE